MVDWFCSLSTLVGLFYTEVSAIFFSDFTLVVLIIYFIDLFFDVKHCQVIIFTINFDWYIFIVFNFYFFKSQFKSLFYDSKKQ